MTTRLFSFFLSLFFPFSFFLSPLSVDESGGGAEDETNIKNCRRRGLGRLRDGPERRAYCVLDLSSAGASSKFMPVYICTLRCLPFAAAAPSCFFRIFFIYFFFLYVCQHSYSLTLESRPPSDKLSGARGGLRSPFLGARKKEGKKKQPPNAYSGLRTHITQERNSVRPNNSPTKRKKERNRKRNAKESELVVGWLAPLPLHAALDTYVCR